MDAESREKRITEIMGEILSVLSREGPLSLSLMSAPYRSSKEIGLCLIAFSRLEAEGLIAKQSDEKWKISRGANTTSYSTRA